MVDLNKVNFLNALDFGPLDAESDAELLAERPHWLVHDEHLDVFLPMDSKLRTANVSFFFDEGVDWEVVRILQRVHWPFSVSW